MAAGGAGNCDRRDQPALPSSAPPRCARTRSPAGSRSAASTAGRPLSGARPAASLNRRALRRALQSSASSYPHVIVNMRKRSIAESGCTHQPRVAPVPDAARWRLRQTEPAFRRAQQDQPAVRRNHTAIEIGGHLFVFEVGRPNGRRVSSVMADAALSLPGKKGVSHPLSYPISTIYAITT